MLQHLVWKSHITWVWFVKTPWFIDSDVLRLQFCSSCPKLKSIIHAPKAEQCGGSIFHSTAWLWSRVSELLFSKQHHGNLDWNGNPSLFSRVQDEATFQAYISQKWFDKSTSFFSPMKIWCFEPHLALVSCQHLHFSRNGSHLQKKCPKGWVSPLSKDAQCKI